VNCQEIVHTPSPVDVYVAAALASPPVVISCGISVHAAFGAVVFVLRLIQSATVVPTALPMIPSIQFLPIVVRTPAW